MKTKVEYTWDDDDTIPMGKRLSEAFNRVLNFCPEIYTSVDKPTHRPPELISFNRVTNGEFDMNDLRRLHSYALKVQADIVAKYASQPQDPASESILQAAKNLVEVMGNTVGYVAHFRRA